MANGQGSGSVDSRPDDPRRNIGRLQPLPRREESGQAPHPRAVMDAGGATGVVLLQAIQRRLDDLGNGQVLQIISQEPQARRDIGPWQFDGHALLVRTEEHAHETWFWIRKV